MKVFISVASPKWIPPDSEDAGLARELMLEANRKIFYDIVKHKLHSSTRKFEMFETEFHTVRMDMGFVLTVLDDKTESIKFCFVYKKGIPIQGGMLAKEICVWSDQTPKMRGLYGKVLTAILSTVDYVECDDQHTEQGKKFWQKFVAEKFKEGNEVRIVEKPIGLISSLLTADKFEAIEKELWAGSRNGSIIQIRRLGQKTNLPFL